MVNIIGTGMGGDLYLGKGANRGRHRDSISSYFSYPIDDGDLEGNNKRNGASVIFDVHKIEGTSITAIGKTASLYLPQGFQVADGVSYTNGDLGKLGMIAKQGTATGQSGFNVLSASAGSLVSDAWTGVKSLGDKNLTQQVAAFLETKQGTRAGIQAGARATRNPYTVALFERVNTRVFTFSFKLIPTSKEEADRIKNIIDMFRSELYPELIGFDGGGGGIPGGYRFPNVFKIHVIAKGKEFANQFKLCQLSTVNTTYNSNSMAFHEDGHPVETEMTLNFTEIETLNKNDVEAGF